MLGMIGRPLLMTHVAGGTSEAAFSTEFPKLNALNNDYGRVARTTTAPSDTTLAFYWDLGATPPAVDFAAVLWHNLRAGDTIQVRGGTSLANVASGTGYISASLSAIVGTSGRDIAAPGKFLLTMSALQTYRYWGFFLTSVGSANPAGYLQVSRMLLGKKALFAVGPQRALYDANDFNSRIQLETGDERASEDTLLIRPIAQLDFGYAKESELAEVLGGYTLSLGTSRPMLICPDLTGTNLQDTIVFGRPEKVIAPSSDSYDIWKFQAQVRSLGP